MTFWDDVTGAAMSEWFGEPFELEHGRKTYEIFAAHWPYMDNDPIADLLNGVTKHVASRTLDKVEWNGARLLGGDVASAIRHLKESDGPPLNVQGSSNLLQTLWRHDLVDRFRTWTFPVVLGHGKRLFEPGVPPRGLRLIDSRVSTTGVLIATYEPCGDVPLGSFLPTAPSKAELHRRAQLTE